MPNLILMFKFQALSYLPSGFILGRRMDSCVIWFHHWAQFNAILWFSLLNLSFWSYFRNESKTDLCLKKSCSFIQYLKQWYKNFLIVEELKLLLFWGRNTSIFFILYLLSQKHISDYTYIEITGNSWVPSG